MSLCTNWWVHGDVAGKPIPADFPFDWAREMLRQHREIRGLYCGDYYPLTLYSTADDVWLAYQSGVGCSIRTAGNGLGFPGSG